MLVILLKFAPDRAVTPSSTFVLVTLNRSNWKAAVPEPDLLPLLDPEVEDVLRRQAPGRRILHEQDDLSRAG